VKRAANEATTELTTQLYLFYFCFDNAPRFARRAATKYLNDHYPFFEGMIEALLIGSHHDPLVDLFNHHEHLVGESDLSKNLKISDFSDKVKNLTNVDGYDLGLYIKVRIDISSNEEGVVDKFIDDFAAMREFSEQNPFFRGCMVKVARALMSKVTTAKILKSVASSVFSIGDLATDIYAITFYLQTSEEQIYAWLMFFFIVSSLLLQCLIVWINHRHNKWVCVREILFTLTMIKPGLNKFRVLTNQQWEEGE